MYMDKPMIQPDASVPWPGLTVLALWFLVTSWAIVGGVFDIIAAGVGSNG
jgi:hypothetical protein